MQSRTKWMIASIICHSLAFGLMVTSLVGDSWAIIQMKNGAHILGNNQVVTLNGEVLGNYGLWEYCTKNTSICNRINHFYGQRDSDWFKACQISTTTACIFALTAFLAALINPCCSECASVISALNMFLAWACMTGAVAIFTAKETTNLNSSNLMEKRSWGWTFLIAWCSSGVSLFASIVAWLSYTPKRAEPEVETLFF